MKSLSALRQAFGLKKNEDVDKLFTADQLKKIVAAMQEYAGCKCREQRVICQDTFDNVLCGCYYPDTELINLCELKELKGCDDPNFD